MVNNSTVLLRFVQQLILNFGFPFNYFSDLKHFARTHNLPPSSEVQHSIALLMVNLELLPPIRTCML